MVAYVLWEHGVASSSLVTSTKKRIPICSSCEQVLGTKCLRNLSEQMGILFSSNLKKGYFLFCHFIDSLDICQSVLDGRTSLNPVLDGFAFLFKAAFAHSAGSK